MLQEQGTSQDHAASAGRIDLHDVQLIKRIALRDLRAFEALYRSYFPRLVRFLDRMTRSPALIEEVVNDTMFVVWEKAHTFNRTSKVSTWIFSIAYRKALKAIGRSDEPVEMDVDLESAVEIGPENQLSQRQLEQSISLALDAIPFDQRTVINLAFYHGMAYQEIADTMECPVNTVKTRMFHARRRLKDLLAKVME